MEQLLRELIHDSKNKHKTVEDILNMYEEGRQKYYEDNIKFEKEREYFIKSLVEQSYYVIRFHHGSVSYVRIHNERLRADSINYSTHLINKGERNLNPLWFGREDLYPGHFVEGLATPITKEEYEKELKIFEDLVASKLEKSEK